jgi:hypothetical protein
MAKYVLVYQGGAMAETEEAQQAAMAAWGSWFGSLGSAVVDGGAPFGPSAAVGGGGSKTGLTGYSILEGKDLDAAVKLAEGCPIVADGGSVDVYETIDVGG